MQNDRLAKCIEFQYVAGALSQNPPLRDSGKNTVPLRPLPAGSKLYAKPGDSAVIVSIFLQTEHIYDNHYSSKPRTVGSDRFATKRTVCIICLQIAAAMGTGGSPRCVSMVTCDGPIP